jgi:hypothetical protein
MMITDAGIIIQLRMEDIPTHGRITSGVKMINLDEEVKVAKIAKVREKVTEDGQEIDLNEESDVESEEVTETEEETSGSIPYIVGGIVIAAAIAGSAVAFKRKSSDPK